MDVTSYLLGKQAGGGSTPTLQSKEVTITENGTTNVTADAGYDGLSNVGITTNVQPNLESKSRLITTNGTIAITPTEGKDGMSSVNITTIVNGASEYYNTTLKPTSANGGLKYFVKKTPSLQTSKLTSFSYFFSGYNNLTSVSPIDTSSATNFSYMFENCTSLATAPELNTSKGTNFSYMYTYCSALQNVPVYDWSKVTGSYNLVGMFQNCNSLTDQSVDNVLQSCISAVNFPGNKKFTMLGFNINSYPISRMETLPHYQDFIDAGWTVN